VQLSFLVYIYTLAAQTEKKDLNFSN